MPEKNQSATQPYEPVSSRYDAMKYRRSGNSGLMLPALSLGFWHNFGAAVPLDRQRAIVRRALGLGITHLDLANNYGPPPGSAEENLGRIIAADLQAQLAIGLAGLALLLGLPHA